MSKTYIENLVEKFNKDRYDPEISEGERNLLIKIEKIERQAADVIQKLEETNKKLQQEQESIGSLNRELIHLRGQTKALTDLLAEIGDQKEEPKEQ